jgi:hypothetical protein
MKRATPSVRPLLPALLIMLLIFFLIFMALRLIYPQTPRSRPTSTVRAPTPTITRTLAVTATNTATPTITRTPRPTWTLRPTYTRTITSTPGPTETPLPPVMPTWVKPIQYNDLYLLRPWSPEEADNVVKLLQAYPDTLYPNSANRETSTYNAAFTYVVYLQREALLRYPNDPLSDSWRWGLAYNLAHTNDPGVGEAYAALIQDELEKGFTSLEDLPEWFSQHEYRLQLSIHRFTPPPGYLNRLLLEISTQGGAVYLWAVESPQKIDLYTLSSYFDFAHGIEVHFTAGDLTGDGLEELVIYADPRPGETIPGLPQVVSLIPGSPPQISFAPQPPFELGTEYQLKWVIEHGVLHSNVTIYPACAVQVTTAYQWDGAQLAPESTGVQKW